MQISPFLSAIVLASVAMAQGVVISPVGTTNVEGSGSNSFPWNSAVARRYMQLHGDLAGQPLLITMVSFRAQAGTSNNLGTRINDLELYMGEGLPALQPSYTFDANYVAPKTLVIPRTTITFGPQGQLVSPGPNPFTGNMDLVLPAPFFYSGSNSLVWEVTYYGQTIGAAGTFSAQDAEQGVVTSATSSVTGTGCIATGQTTAMTHALTCNDTAGTLVLNATVTAGPANALTFWALGFSNPNLAFPGLCGNVYTDAIVTKTVGFTDAAGAITTDHPTGTTISLPNSIPGVTLTSQFFSLDAARPDPLPVCASNGRIVTIPTSNLTRINDASRIFNNAGGTTATEGIWFASTIGYSLVTQFSHL